MTSTVLLERRDSERKISPKLTGGITRSGKELLLQSLAYWMLINSKQSVSFDEADNCFRRAASRIPDLSGLEDKITRFLLDRSSIIRESTEGYVDFVHKTFSEYLAAKYIATEDCINQLLEHSMSKSWQEVIVMTPMHTNEKQSNLLIDGLIKKGNEELGAEKYKLHLLAVAAKENTLLLDPEIANKSNDILKTLLPPRNTESSLFISSVGEMVVPFLKYHENMDNNEVSHSIKTLSLIGGPSSIEALSSYTKSKNDLLLISIWKYFNQKEYSRKVISKLNNSLTLTWPYLDSLDGVEYLNNIRELCFIDLELSETNEYLKINSAITESMKFINCKNLTSLTFLSESNDIKKLSIKKCNDLNNINSVFKLSNLIYLFIEKCEKLNNIDRVSDLEKLSTLSIKDCTELKRIPNLRKSKYLSSIVLDGCLEISDLDFLKECKYLRDISIDNCPDINDLSPLSGCTEIQQIQTDNGLLRDKYEQKYRKIFQ